MKHLLALLTTAMLSIGACACGDASKAGVSTSHSSTSTVDANHPESSTASTSVYTKADSDKDNDVGAPYDDTNNDTTLNYGHEASPAEKQAVTELIKRYYAIATAADGAKACSMLVSSLANAVAEDYGRGSGGPSYLKAGTTCPAVMDLLFRHSHDQLATELPALSVARVRLIGHRGLAILDFGALEREISVVREGHAWKIVSLLDRELP